MSSHDYGGDDDDGDNDDDWTNLPFFAKLSLTPGGRGLVALRLDTVWTWGSGSLRSSVSWPRWVKCILEQGPCVFDKIPLVLHEISWDLQVEASAAGSTFSYRTFDLVLWFKFMRSMVRHWDVSLSHSFPNAAALGVAGSVWAVVLSCAASAAGRSLGLTASAAQLKPKDLCAYMSKISGNSRHGYTMVYNIMQPIYDNDTMASEQKGDVYILLAISSTEWGGLGCLYGTILWELVALNGVGHTIL